MSLGMTTKRDNRVVTAIIAALLAVAAWFALSAVLPAYSACPPGSTASSCNCSNIAYGISASASMTWNPSILGDTVAVPSKSYIVTLSCVNALSVTAPPAFSLFNLYSQTGSFQVLVSVVNSQGLGIGSATVNPTLTPNVPIPVAVYAQANIGLGTYTLSGTIQEYGCPQIVCAFGLGNGWINVGSFACKFIISSSATSGSVTGC